MIDINWWVVAVLLLLPPALFGIAAMLDDRARLKKLSERSCPECGDHVWDARAHRDYCPGMWTR